VAIGTAADMMVQPYGALLVGSIAGTLSVVGFDYITPALEKHCRVHDTCGVHNLHGLPGVLAGIVGAILAGMASFEEYDNSLYVLWPAMQPGNATEDAAALQLEGAPGLMPGRSASMQGGMQILAVVVTIVIAIVGGLLTGLLMRLGIWERLETGDLFSDRRYFHVHDAEPELAEPGNMTVPSKEDTQM